MRWKYRLSHLNPSYCAQQGIKPEGTRAGGCQSSSSGPYPPLLPLSCRRRGPVAGGRTPGRLAACPHPTERVCSGSCFSGLWFPPCWAGLIHLDSVAGRRAQQATGVRHPPAGGCRLVTKAVGPTKKPFEQALRTRFSRKSTVPLHSQCMETSCVLFG